MTTALVVLVAVIVGGLYIFWRWTQDQYYVAAGSTGEVVIYRGINQSIVGIGLSSPYQQTGIPLAQVPSNYQQTVKSAYATGSLAQVQQIVANIRTAVEVCRQQYTALENWVVEEDRYQAEVAQAQRLKRPASSIPTPGPQPPGAAATCPSSQAFGIPASALEPAPPGLP